MYRVEDDGERIVIGLRLLHPAEISPLIQVPDGHGDQPGLLTFCLLDGRVVRAHLVGSTVLCRDVGGSAESVRIAVSLAQAVKHLEVVTGQGVQPPPADCVGGLHGADMDQWLMVGANEEGAVLEVVTVVLHEVQDGHQFAFGGIVVGLGLPQLLHP